MSLMVSGAVTEEICAALSVAQAKVVVAKTGCRQRKAGEVGISVGKYLCLQVSILCASC